MLAATDKFKFDHLAREKSRTEPQQESISLCKRLTDQHSAVYCDSGTDKDRMSTSTAGGHSPTAKRGGLRSLRLGEVPEHRKHEVAKLGERLRLRWHDEAIIKDRRYHMRLYSKCFPANLAVDCLMDRGDADTRQQAVCIMKNLQRFDLVHHVVDDHDFKDDFLFFRFREDDGTYKPDPSPQDIIAGQRLYSRLAGTSLIQDRKYHGKQYPRCVVGNELVDFLIAGGMFPSRTAAVEHCRDLLEAGVLHHVCYDHHFNDEYLFYRFENDESRGGDSSSPQAQRKLSASKRPQSKEVHASVSSMGKGQAEEHEREANTGSPQNRHDSKTSFNRFTETNHSKNSFSSNSGSEASLPLAHAELEPSLPIPSSFAQGHEASSMASSGGNSVPTSPPPYIFSVTVEQMMDPSLGFQKRVIQVVSDPVGFGFVIRGGSPVHVHTVDPTGPAAQSGLQVGDLLLEVNGQDVREMTHGQVARIIVQGSAVANLVVLVHPNLQ
eukprot:scpid13875/ scgid6726/ DEP domain-containing mTOR-interacting protein; DEP domain-containing protein 6